jgi:hypothetical protein
MAGRTSVRWAAVFVALATSALYGDDFPQFREQVIDPHCGMICYAVIATDVDGDGRQDIVAVTEDRVLWYQAPGWERRTIIDKQTDRDNVCIAPLDIDGDGLVDFALGAGWTKIGSIQWISRGDSLDKNWRVHLVGHEQWLHRMRFADVLGTGKPQLVISPLNRTVGDGVQLTAFEIPNDPRVEKWPATVIDDKLNRMHNHWHVDFDDDGRIDTLTASEEGIHLFQHTAEGWRKTRVGSGAQDDDPKASGAGEIKTGRLAGGDLFIATVEPMHGTQAVIYTRPDSPDKTWVRTVIDDTLKRGHAVWTADLDGDPADEVIIGHSEAGATGRPGLFVFDDDDGTGVQWMKHVLDDGGVAVEDAFAADMTGDGLIDIVAGGRDTHNIKLYVNLGTSRQPAN